MEFYNREMELEKLKNIQKKSEKSGKFTVLMGMRRVGKTLLYLEFAKQVQTPTLYFFVARKEEALLVEDFVQETREKLGIFVPEMKSFETLFEFLLVQSQTMSFTLMIDEFQDFNRINTSIFSVIQKLWDLYKRESKLNLIVCGSIYSLMQKIFTGQKQPLFGRPDYRMMLRPFETPTLKKILDEEIGNWNNDDLLALYTVTGGIPRYIELIIDEQTTDTFSQNEMFETLINENSFFIDEGNILLISEFGKKYELFYSILSCIARGINEQSKIEQALDGRSIGSYIKQLIEEYEIIERLTPILSADGTKKVKYKIRNQFLTFWFRYFDRHRSLIETRNFDRLKETIIADYPVFSGKALEGYFIEKLKESKGFTNIGSWWNDKDGSDEIDIVAIDSLNKTVLIAEVKRNPKKFQKTIFDNKVFNLTNRHFKKYEINSRLLSIDDM
ncbi:MAG: ATP-binding protein [Streptococcaceae bacterium]|nr:ATP-binding protein [Streptococcaceae bacterium]